MSGLYTLVLRDDYQPAKTEFYDAFVVHADTERKAWTAVQKHVKDAVAEDNTNDKPEDWLKSSQRVRLTHIGEAEEGINLGILVASFVGD